MRGLLGRSGVHMLMALPLLGLVGQWAVAIVTADPRAAGLSAEPIAYSINTLGLWALRSLLLTLAITPLRRATGWGWLAPLRRPIGLWCFAYATLHLSVYFGLNLLGSLEELAKEIAKHPFILFGMAAWALVLPLALTSTRASIRRLGAKRWQTLHRLIYGAAVLAAVHFILRVKGFQIEPWIYAAVAALLVLARVVKLSPLSRR
ncbi:MAG: sulfoxide reductase heme-binding subunit YedZ [Sphingobium sp.]|nr:sulfoxide reductase heme-binding subunit YedZ [Sphingobium sp.]MCI1270359.1 sulfoxide reductase heme-binding subunit YedZ [Sphingobium sp.]MCI1755506.1 sulfoxide reductase heme-binding subunit YedZ [Sphingobium sp.]MCI2052116.1 sulfoxide reductase heme-binding subunit YedZ [Sphingobium sp.]